MRVRLFRTVVVLALIVLAGVPMLPGRAFGTVVLTGQGVALPCDETLDWTCSFSSPMKMTSLVYDARVASANTVVFEYVPGYNESVCTGEPGPGQCGTVGTGRDQFVFTDGFADITAQGMCGNVGPRIGSCYVRGGSEWTPSYVDNSLPVVITTKAQNDQITSIIPPFVGQEFAFSINTGDGNDVVTLVDNTGHGYGGADQISCGSGNDRVTTNSDVSVGSDCETVTRLT